MSHYVETLTKRTAITVVNTAGAASLDINVVIPPEWDDFWTWLTALADDVGDSIRVTDSDGVTLLDYSVDDGSGGTFSAAAKTGRIQIDAAAMTATANTIVCLWLYWGGTDALADASTATTITSAATGYIDLGAPSLKSHSVRSQAVGRTTPYTSYAKGSNDTDDVWLDWSGWLEKSNTDQIGSRAYEEPKHAVVTAVDEGGTPSTSVYTVGSCRWNEQPDGRVYLRVQVTAGTNGTNYTISPKVTTVVPNDSAAHRVYQERFGLHVVDVQEAA